MTNTKESINFKEELINNFINNEDNIDDVDNEDNYNYQEDYIGDLDNGNDR